MKKTTLIDKSEIYEKDPIKNDKGEHENILYLDTRERNIIYKIGTIYLGQQERFLKIDGNDIVTAHYEDKFSMGKEPIKISRIVTKFKE